MCDSTRSASNTPSHRRSWLTDDRLWIIGLWAILGAVHSPAISGVVTYFHNDLWSWFLPVHDYLRRELWQGHLLPWCPLVACGYPLSAEPQTGIFYPLNLIFALPLPIGSLMGLSLWIHYSIAATGIFVLARRFGCAGLGSFAAALVFSATGFMVAHLHHFAIITAAAWFPWAWYALWSYRLRPRRRYLALLWWCAAAQLVAGQPQVWLLTFASGVLWLLLAELLLPQMTENQPGRARAARWLALWGAVALGTAAAAVTILPMMELYQQSTRSTPTLDFITSYSLGNVTMRSLAGLRSAFPDHWEYEGFAGLTTLLLALLAILSGKSRGRIQLLLAMLLIAFFMGLGTHNPLYRLFLHVPLLSGFRCPARWLLIISACLALLAGWGLTELAGRRRWLALALTAGLSVEVILFAISYVPIMAASELSSPAFAKQPREGRLISSLPWRLPPNSSELEQFRVGRRLLTPNLGLLWGVASAQGYMPLQLREYDRLWKWAGAEQHPERAAMLGVKHMLKISGEGPATEGWEAVGEQGGVALYRNRFYRDWCWLEKPEPEGYGIAYGWYATEPFANCTVSKPNRLVFSVVRGDWLTATVSGRPVPLEPYGGGLSAVRLAPGDGLVVLRYRHPRLYEGLAVSGVALALFVIFIMALPRLGRRR